MEKEDYQANWRGARRYQFDEETRLKKMAMQSRDGVVRFRRVKWADPEQKLKVLVEDLHHVPEQRAGPERRVEWPDLEQKLKVLEKDFHQIPQQRAWIERISTRQFCLLAFSMGAIAFCGVAFWAGQ